MTEQLHPVNEYALKVLSGEIVTGNLVKLACERHFRDLKNPDFYFSESDASEMLDFFPKYLRHSKGAWAGKPVELELWQKFVLGSLFGWKNKDGTRKYTHAYIQIARKNGKTTLMAGVGLKTAFFDKEGGAEVYCVATTEAQAGALFSEASKMRKQSPIISKYTQGFKDNISCDFNFSKFEPLASNSEKLDGLNVYVGLIEEYHAHPSSALYDVINSAKGARTQPMMIIITTAGFNVNSACFKEYEFNKKILRGIINCDTQFAYIAQLDEKETGELLDDPFDEKNWIKANPNLGVSYYVKNLKDDALKAKLDPSKLNNYLVKNLNIWVRQNKRYIDMSKWLRLKKETKLEDLAGFDCVIGMDLSSTTDFTSISILGKNEEGVLINYSKFYLPEEKILEYELKGQRHFREWTDAGYITATPGDVIDYDFIKHDISEIAKICNVIEIGFDPWNARQLANDLDALGFKMVEVRQGVATMSSPTKHLLTLIAKKQIEHGNNPVLNYCADNMIVSTDSNGNVKPDKEKASQKIDGVVALIISISRMMSNPVNENKPIKVNAYLV